MMMLATEETFKKTVDCRVMVQQRRSRQSGKIEREREEAREVEREEIEKLASAHE